MYSKNIFIVNCVDNSHTFFIKLIKCIKSLHYKMQEATYFSRPDESNSENLHYIFTDQDPPPTPKPYSV